MAKKRRNRASHKPQPEPVPKPDPAQEQSKVQEQDQSQPEPEEITNQVGGEDKEKILVEKEGDDELNTNGDENGRGNCSDDDVVLAGTVSGEEKNVEEDFEEESLENVLEPFTKKQLKEIISEAVTKHPDFMETVTALADKYPSHRNIFVRGLESDTTAETLTNLFGKYGEIEDCKVDYSTKSKGYYAFILFKHRNGAMNALKNPQKKIGDVTASCHLAFTGDERKIFVRNVFEDINPQKLMEFFSQYVEIEEGPLGLDKKTGKPKGFCFFVYKKIESAKKVLEEPVKIFEGHTLICSQAFDVPKQKNTARSGNLMAAGFNHGVVSGIPVIGNYIVSPLGVPVVMHDGVHIVAGGYGVQPEMLRGGGYQNYPQMGHGGAWAC